MLCFMLHLAVVNSTATLQILQVLVLNLGLPWALAAQEPDIMGKEWSPSPRVKTIQDDIVGTLEKVCPKCRFFHAYRTSPGLHNYRWKETRNKEWNEKTQHGWHSM